MAKFKNIKNYIIYVVIDNERISILPQRTIEGPSSLASVDGLQLVEIPQSNIVLPDSNVSPEVSQNYIKVYDEGIFKGWAYQLNFVGGGVQADGTNTITVYIPGSSGNLTNENYITKNEVVSISSDLQSQIMNNNYVLVAIKDLTGALQTQKISDAPNDGNQYARLNGVWSIVQTVSGGTQIHNALSGLQGGNGLSEYYHMSLEQYENLISKLEVSNVTGSLQTQINNKVSADILRTEVSNVTGSLQTQATNNASNISLLVSITGSLQTQKLSDAPSDGNQYARKDGTWTVVHTTSGGSTDLSEYLTAVQTAGLTGSLQTQITSLSASSAYSGLTDETLSGSANGSNTQFVFSNTPKTDVLVFINGIKMAKNVDYTLINSTVTFTSGAIPQPGDIVEGSYGTSIAVGTAPIEIKVNGNSLVQSIKSINFAGNGVSVSNVSNDVTVNISAGSGVDTTTVAGLTGSLQTQINNKVSADILRNEVASLTGQLQQTLVSGTNIKTINGITVLGSGNISTGTVISISSGDGLNSNNITASGVISVDNTVSRARRTSYVDIDVTGSNVDRYIGFTGLSSNRSYTLPLASSVPAGHIIIVGDDDGSCRPFRKITINTAQSDTIEGSSYSEILDLPGANIAFCSNGSSNWLISSKYPSTIPSGGYYYTRRFWCAEEDFILPSVASIGNWRYSNSTATGLNSNFSNEANFGCFTAVPGVSAGQYSAFTLGNPGQTGSSPILWSQQDSVWMDARVKVIRLPDTVNDVVNQVGVMPRVATPAGTRGIYFVMDKTNKGDTNWYVCCKNSTITQSTDYISTSTPAVSGTWVNLSIDATPGTSAKFYINGQLVYTENTGANVYNAALPSDNLCYGVSSWWISGGSAWSSGSIAVDRLRVGVITKPSFFR
jgi:hypothetical protein